MYLSHYDTHSRPYIVIHSPLASKGLNQQQGHPPGVGALVTLPELIDNTPMLGTYLATFTLSYSSSLVVAARPHSATATAATAGAASPHNTNTDHSDHPSDITEALSAIVKRFRVYGHETNPIPSKPRRIISSLLLNDSPEDLIVQATLLGDFETDLSRLLPTHAHARSSSTSRDPTTTADGMTHRYYSTTLSTCHQQFQLYDTHSNSPLTANDISKYQYFTIVLDENYGHPDYTRLGYPRFQLIDGDGDDVPS